MRKLTSFVPTLAILLLNFGVVFAQRRNPDADAGAACAVCGAGMGAMIIVPIYSCPKHRAARLGSP